MNYNQGITHMTNLCKKGAGKFSPYRGITISYPEHRNIGDYHLSLQGNKTPTHSHISQSLYDLINHGTCSFTDLERLLNDVYSNGTNTLYTNNTLSYVQHLIYWTTLQEEINYPRFKDYTGRNLAFCRFYEAIYSTELGCEFTIEEVLDRCDNNNTRPKLYNISTAPHFYHY